MRGIATLALLLVISLPEARAQQSEDSRMDAEARSLYDAGVVAYEQGRYENALDYFARAHELSDRPQLLFNVASAADRLRQDARALEAYRGYLRQSPDADNRVAVEARIRILEEQLADADPDPETDPDADADAPPQSGGVARTIVIIGSAVVLATGVALGVVGIRDFARVEGIQDGDAWSDFEDSHDRARPMMVTGAVLTVVGVAGLIVGALMKSRPDSNVAFDGQTMRVRW